jgi:nucleoside-diphosphate-sugar epimerase
MARILVTGSTAGLALAAAAALLDGGHDVILHAAAASGPLTSGRWPDAPRPWSSATWPTSTRHGSWPTT